MLQSMLAPAKAGIGSQAGRGSRAAETAAEEEEDEGDLMHALSPSSSPSPSP